MGLRRKARECALQVLYSIDVCQMEVDEGKKTFWKKCRVPGKVSEFADFLIDGTSSNLSIIDSIIKKLAKNWDIDRMSAIDRNIMRQACYELMYNSETPYKVVINEAIELAKKYSTEDSGKFVNGILDKVKGMKIGRKK